MIPRINWPPNTPPELRRTLDEIVDAIRRETNTAYSLPTYADNTAALAGGLEVGAMYRTSSGSIMVVH
jgi:hypothetical protein